MSNTTPTKQKNPDLTREIQLMKSLLISLVGRDHEGNYQPEFAKKILLASEEKPTKTFKDPASFLRELKNVSIY